MSFPDDRRYLKSHEWHKLEGDVVLIGISQQAVDELTDVTYVDITVPDGEIKAGEAFGEIESVKATSEMYCGIDGEVVEVNGALEDNPGLVNEDCYGKAWMIKVKPSDPSQLDGLLSAEQYGG